LGRWEDAIKKGSRIQVKEITLTHPSPVKGDGSMIIPSPGGREHTGGGDLFRISDLEFRI
jgi:hypothetical protein